jgi:hypothetical protein
VKFLRRSFIEMEWVLEYALEKESWDVVSALMNSKHSTWSFPNLAPSVTISIARYVLQQQLTPSTTRTLASVTRKLPHAVRASLLVRVSVKIFVVLC